MKKLIPFIIVSAAAVLTCSAALVPPNFVLSSGFNTESAPSNPNSIRADSGGRVGYITNGSWFGFTNYDFGAGVSHAVIEAASGSAGGTIQLRTGSATGTVIGTVTIPNTGGYTSFRSFYVPLTGMISGVQNLYFTFSGGGGFLLDTRAFWFPEVAPNAKQAGSAYTAGLFDTESHPVGAPVTVNAGTVESITDDSWVAYTGFDFGTDANRVEIEASAAERAGRIELRIDSLNGPLVGSVDVNHTGSWTYHRIFSANLTQPVSGSHDLYLRFVNSNGATAGATLFHLKRFSVFRAPAPPVEPPTASRLNVYPPVSGLDPSPYYTFSVQKISEFNAATKQANTNWLSPYAWFTQCIANTAASQGSAYYEEFIGSWSHTYCNFELDKETPIVVKITRLNKPGAPSGPITSAVASPAHNVISCEIIGGDVYVTMSKPALIAVDIDGQMEGRDAPRNIPNEWNGATTPFTTEMTATHSLSIFANPVIEDKPVLNDPSVFAVEPGTLPPTSGSWTTVYFKPGIHKLSVDAQGNEREWEITDPLPLVSGKNYYIPGDAIVYGNMGDNEDQNSRANIRIFGHGTLSGKKIPHFENFLNPAYSLSYPSENYLTQWRTLPGDKKPGDNNGKLRMISLFKADNCHYEGLTIADQAEHGLRMFHEGTRGNSLRWIKSLSWRKNNDSVSMGGKGVVEDCFFRHQDDGLYVNGYDVRRCVFWTDVNGVPIRCSYINTARSNAPYVSGDVVVEDCDVIYARGVYSFVDGTESAVISDPDGSGTSSHPDGTPGTAQDLIFRNFRVTDPRPQRALLGFKGNAANQYYFGWKGIRFENVEYRYPNTWGSRSTILGTTGGPAKYWTFDNVTIGGAALDENLFNNQASFQNSNASDMIYRVKPGQKFLHTPSTVYGSVSRNIAGTFYVPGSSVKLTPVPAHGFMFSSWGGALAGSTANPATVVMDADKTVTANYVVKPATGINCGGGAFTAADGTVFQADGYSVWGQPYSTASTISGTPDQSLYKSERWGGFDYNIPQPNGTYEVTLKFAELYFNSAGSRVFNVAIEGTQVISNLDIFSKVGKNAVYDETHTVTVSGGVLNMNFTSVVDNAKISAIRIKPLIANTYQSWAATNAGNATPAADFDNDGVRNGIEYFMGEAGGTSTMIGDSVVWPKDPNALATPIVETSTNLIDWTPVTSGVIVGATSVSYTFPENAPAAFTRLRVVIYPN